MELKSRKMNKLEKTHKKHKGFKKRKQPEKADELEVANNAKLNPKQELFCKLYISDREFFGNGVQAYFEAYRVDKSKISSYKTACANASRLLSNDKVLNRINELLENKELNDAFVDKQLAFLITQHSDLRIKLGAIREYNKLKQRITEKIENKLPILIDDMFSSMDDKQIASNNLSNAFLDPNL